MLKKVKMIRTVPNFSSFIYLSFAVFLTDFGHLYAQNPIPNRVEVRVKDVSFLPGETSFAPSVVQQVYGTYNVSGYVQKYPAAVGLSHPLAEGLTRVYDLMCDCDATQLESALAAFTPDIFENVYLTYEEQLLSPPPYLPNDPLNAPWNFWHHDLINTPEAWDISKGDPGIRIAITDVGFDINHPDLVNKIVYMDANISLAPDPLHGSHGTGVAFTAAGDTDNGFGYSSAGFNCSLMLFPAFNYNKMLEAANLGASIINCSWLICGGYNTNQHNVVKMITDMGVIIVAGAGNGNHCSTGFDSKYYPASYPEVISVTSTAHFGCLETTFNCWGPAWDPPRRHTHNDAVDIAAPGFCVMTATYDDTFDFSVGTSIASPMVCGVIGLMLSVDPCLAPAEVTDIIKGTSQNLFDGTLCNGGNNANFQQNLPGVGLIDAHASVLAVDANGQEFHVNSGQTVVWDNQDIEAKDIYVHSGGTLIIKNGSVVRMQKGKSIIVEREAKLIVDNSTITGRCTKSIAKWRGIFVHGNASLPQPNLSVGNLGAVQSYVFGSDEAGVVFLTNQTRIENARYGISTSAPGYDYDPGQTSRWGGLVLVNNTTFYNVIQGVEFMKYDLPNKSRVVNSRFTKSADYQANVTGITVWENIGLEFLGNTFDNMDFSGIGGIDYSAKITDENKFENCKFGIEIHCTAPKSSSILIKDNYFDGNETHIYSAGASSDYGLQVIHNEFFTSNKYGVRIEGPSAYSIDKNAFYGNAMSGVVAVNTSDKFSYVRGNFLGQGKEGLTFRGNNQRSQFLSNCFAMDETDVAIEQYGTNLGRVRTQGNSGLPAGNCFTSGIEHIRAVQSQTHSFIYFIPAGGEPQLNPCPGVIVPNVNGNNFSLAQALTFQYEGCGTFGRNEAEYTFNDLITVRNDKAAIQQALLATPEDTNLLMQLEQKEELEGNIEAFLEHGALQAGDFDLAESIYAGLADRDAKISLYGIKLRRRQFAQARSILNTLATTSIDEQLFAQIQHINLDRWEQTGYTPDESTLSFLYNTAMSSSEVRAYAGSLYYLLKGEHAIPDLDFGQGIGNRSEAAEKIEKPLLAQRYAVYPNPASSSMILSMPEEDQRDGVVEIYDIAGKRVFAMPFGAATGSSLILPVEGLSRGFLILTVRRAGLLTFTSKIILQK
ncbi:MAG: S8 family serine peptidase [candidate division WOR-3 bacterium]